VLSAAARKLLALKLQLKQFINSRIKRAATTFAHRRALRVEDDKKKFTSSFMVQLKWNYGD
jgi:hypothetical protein